VPRLRVCADEEFGREKKGVNKNPNKLLFVCFKLDTNKAELYEEVEIPVMDFYYINTNILP
jgi:hypothetical protein